jgi:hypothetical protein
LIPTAPSITSSSELKRVPMKAEIDKTVSEIEQVLTLLRRHL